MRNKPFNFTLILTLEDNCHFPPESSLIPNKYPSQDQYPSPPHDVGFLDLISSRTPFREGGPMISPHLNMSEDREGQPQRTVAITGLRWHLKGGQKRTPGTLNASLVLGEANSTK